MLLLAGGHGGFASVGGATLTPLSVLPGEWFFVIPVGIVSPPTPLVIPLHVPTDRVVRGVTINTQAVVFNRLGLFLSNAVRVVGE